MIITDFNLMSVEELQIISGYIGVRYEINDGKIVGTHTNYSEAMKNASEN